MTRFKFLSPFLVAGIVGVTGCSQSDTHPFATDTSGAYHPIPSGTYVRTRDTNKAETAAARIEPEGSGRQASPRYALYYPTGARESSVLLLEVDGPGAVKVGQPFTYMLRATNLTGTPLGAVQVYDISRGEAGGGPGPAAAAPAPDGAPGAAGVRFPAWNVGFLAPHQTVTQQINATADEVGTLRTCLAVNYTPTLCTTLNVVRPELRVTLEGPSDVLICQDLNYRYTVTNTGTGIATGVRIQENLPEGLSAPDGGRTLTADVGDLQPGESKPMTATLKANRRGQYTLTAAATSVDAPPSKSADVTTTVREPVLAVAVEAPQSRYIEAPINARIVVRNTGDAAAEHAVLHLASNGTNEPMPDRDLGTIAPNDSKTIPINLGATVRGPGEVRLTATAEAACARPVSGVASIMINTAPAFLLECPDSVDPIAVGQSTVYTISVTNQGTAPGTNITVRAVVPAELQFVAGRGATDIKADGQKLSFEIIPTLAPKQTAQWKVECKGVKPGEARFRVELTADTLTAPAVKVEATRVLDATGAIVPAPAAVPASDIIPPAPTPSETPAR